MNSTFGRRPYERPQGHTRCEDVALVRKEFTDLQGSAFYIRPALLHVDEEYQDWQHGNLLLIDRITNRVVAKVQKDNFRDSNGNCFVFR
jgi:hypothetical protein